MEAPRAAPHYLPEVDGLRALAAFGVLAFHYGNEVRLPFLPVGWAGVWLFYVLSGFVITRMLMVSGWRLSARNYLHFSVRRAARIWPLYYGFLFLYVGSDCLLRWQPPHAAALLGFVTFTRNVQFADTDYTQIGYLWTLSVEQQFYLLFPFVYEAARRRGGGVFAWLVAGGILCRGGTAWWLSTAGYSAMENGQVIYFLLPAHVDAFGAGALIAFVGSGKLRQAILGATSVVLAAGAAFVAWRLVSASPGADIGLRGVWQVLMPYAFPPPHGDGAMVWTYVLAVAVSASFLVLALRPGRTLHRVLRLPPLVRAGQVSYGIYVWHGVTVQGVAAAVAGPAAPAWVRIIGLPVAGAATLALATVSYRCFEARFHRAFKDRDRWSRPVRPRGAGGIVEPQRGAGEAT